MSACEAGSCGAAPMRPMRFWPAATDAGTTSTGCRTPPRSIVSASGISGRACTAATSASQDSTGLPSASTTRSPGRSPARSAAPPLTTCPITGSSGGR